MKTLGTKRLIISGFGAVLGLMTLLAVTLTSHLDTITDELATLTEHQFEKALHFSRMQALIRKREAKLAEILLLNDPLDKQQAYNDFVNLASEFLSTREALLQHEFSPAELKLWQSFNTDLRNTGALRNKTAESILVEQTLAHKTAILSASIFASSLLETQLSGLIAVTRKDGIDSLANARERYDRAYLIALLAWIAAVILGTYIAAHVTRTVFRIHHALHHETKRAQEAAHQMEWAASHDSLTNLVNRSEFHRHLVKACRQAKSQGIESALLFLDLDQFKVVNDTCGHRAGDVLLKQLSGRLAASLIQDRDVLARLGGDEFGVLLIGVNSQQASRIAHSLLRVIRDFRFLWHGKSFTIGVSIGMVPIYQNNCEASEVMATADSACYIAKDQGRNRLQTLDLNDALLTKRIGEMNWAQELRSALSENRLTLYAQEIRPIFEVGATQVHYELLVRLHTHNGQIVTPATFIPVAERYGIAALLDRWVIAHACSILESAKKQHQAQANLDDWEQLHFSINLSGQSISNPDLLSFVLQQFRSHGINPSQICFEITETAIITDMDHAISFIRELKKIGSRFALDDFGKGMASFAYLLELDVDIIKIDGSLVRFAADDEVKRTIISSIVNIARAMKVQTVAEFIDSDRTLSALRQIGVDYGQGYHLHRPQPFIDLIKQKIRHGRRKHAICHADNVINLKKVGA